MILKYDKNNERVSLGLKQITPDPWIDVQTVADLEEIAFEFKDKKKKIISN